MCLSEKYTRFNLNIFYRHPFLTIHPHISLQAKQIYTENVFSIPLGSLGPLLYL